VNTFQKSLASWKRVDNVLTEPVQIKDVDDKELLNNTVEGSIEFDSVNFQYPGAEENAIKDVSFKIEKGTTAAFVGRTGAGKTTLVNLIPRLFDATSGSVKVDGIDVKNWSTSALRRGIGYVPQETFLFSTTMKENIAFGVEDASMKQIETAAEKANVLQNILEFEKKFETMVGERGITLSGGQKQRTAIARALIKDPSIIILDDSLSAVDTKTEDEILSHLRERRSGNTTLMISHRISTVKNADIIFYLENGSVVEQGSHEKLLSLEGRYARMYQKQLLEEQLAQI